MKRGEGFQTVKTEGAILPVYLLRRLMDGDSEIPGLRAEDYHLAKSERLNEVATRAWNRVLGAWEGFKVAMEALPESDAGTSLTREKWLLILFQELGYGRLTTRKAFEVEGKTYPISHAWQNTPIHLVSFRLELDKRVPGARGASRVSPHSLVQELLSRADEFLWGFVSNGLSLRLLRDNVSLTRQAYVEFDLQGMMDSEAYSDFFLLYLVCHQSRVEVVEGKGPEHCWLEKWYNTAAQQGVRALDQLRDGVQKAIEALGGGFLAHPANGALREKLRSGALSTQDCYRQVLRQVYRLLFLFVAEDRELLFDPAAPVQTRKLYMEYYSTRRLRALAAKMRGTCHPDLWRGLRLVLGKLHGGSPHLGLPALGSFLFSDKATSDLNCADISNVDLLKGIRALASTVDRNILRPVNYRNLGSEELGSVYESLLEMHPEIHIQATNPEDRFRLMVAAGSERKTTGSYYTPTSLVNCLLDSALDPVLDEACKKPEPEKALLALKVCDPACGSGHFLIAAAHRIAKRLAAIRAGEDEPSPEYYQHALRDVIGHSIYGVDINPMSVELCKVSHWMEAMEPGRPLTFLEHHIKCGNSLLGTTPALLKKGIPDEAFKPIEGDDNEFCTSYKRRNREERRGSRSLFAPDGMPWEQLGDLGPALTKIDAFDDSTLDALQRKEDAYSQFIRSRGYLFGKLLYDTWCAAFVWEKRHSDELPFPITQEILDRIRSNPHNCPPWMQEEIIRLSDEYQFFHWHLEFPDVFRPKPRADITDDEVTGWTGGFDCVLGNPPWEKIQLEEQKFFSAAAPDIAIASARERKAAIQRLKVDRPELYRDYYNALRAISGQTHLAKDGELFPLSGSGNVSTHSLFIELATTITTNRAFAGLVVPSGLATQDSQKHLFSALTKSGRLARLYDFENRQKIFPSIDSRFRFCLLTIGPTNERSSSAKYAFFLQHPTELNERGRSFNLTFEDLCRFSPNTMSCPQLSNVREAALLARIYDSGTAIFRESSQDNPWGWRSWQVFNETHEAALLMNDSSSGESTRLYEAKLFHQFDHRYASYDDTGRVNYLSVSEKKSPVVMAQTRYFVPKHLWSERIEVDGNNAKWIMAFRRITNATNERTSIFSLLPECVTGSQSPAVKINQDAGLTGALLANLNSFVFDFAARRRVGGTDLNHFIIHQLPVLTPDTFRIDEHGNAIIRIVVPHVLELVFTAWDIQAFACDCGYDGPPFIWDEERRFLIRCELDAAFFHLYLGTEDEWVKNGTRELLEFFPAPRDAVDYIMETFPIVKRKDEAAYGSYRTKDTILEIYDKMSRVISENAKGSVAGRRTPVHYQTSLNPPPGPPVDAEGKFFSMYQLDRNDWPAHSHSPRSDWDDTLLNAWFGVCQKQWNHLRDDQVFPWDGREAFVYALIPYLVREQSGEKFEFYRDAALLASHQERCEALLLDDDLKSQYRTIMNKLDWLHFPDAHRVRVGEIRRKLQDKQHIATDSTSGATTLVGEQRLPLFPMPLQPLLPLVLDAAKNLARLQQGALEAAKVSFSYNDIAREFTAMSVA